MLPLRGRIWWISHEARKLIGKPIHQRYKSIVVIIVDSGLLYATVLLLNIILQLTVTHNYSGVLPFVVAPISALMSGLAPTLIIVRAAGGKSVDNVNQMVSSLHFADGDVTQERSQTRPRSSFSLRYSGPLGEA
ncbi:hypothetical protein PM082_011195 [Marasmius tenuissimus]|nr:hypothetical protein PM082_011195 [Marasmius tenuissimus]